MRQSLFALAATAFLLGACEQPQTSTPAAPPTTVKASVGSPVTATPSGVSQKWEPSSSKATSLAAPWLYSHSRTHRSSRSVRVANSPLVTGPSAAANAR